MGIQDKLGRRGLERKRKLYDNQIRLVGRSMYVVRLRTEFDKYGDLDEMSIISDDKIEAILDYPEGIPLFRNRDLETNTVGSFLYDQLPIEAYFKFEDNVMKDDFIVASFYDERNSGFLQAYQVSEILGDFGVGVLSMRYSLAPYNEFLDQQPQALDRIDQYELESFRE